MWVGTDRKSRKSYWKVSLMPHTYQTYQISHVAPGHAIPLTVCILLLPMLVVATEHVQLATTYHSSPKVQGVYMTFRYAPMVLPSLTNLLPAMVLQNRVVRLNSGYTSCSSLHSTVWCTSPSWCLKVHCSLGRRVAGEMVILALLLSGDIEMNPGPVEEQLSVNDLPVVMKELIKVSAKWYDIGVHLGVCVDKLSGIKKQDSDVNNCLRETLRIWLKTYPATWTHIVDALRSSTVGELRLAELLEHKYCSTKYTSTTTHLIPQPHSSHFSPWYDPQLTYYSSTSHDMPKNVQAEVIHPSQHQLGPKSGPLTLRCLRHELHQVSHKWFFLGVQLGVSISALKCIQKDSHIETDCLRKMLAMWLKCTYTPTWNTVIDALESPPVGELYLAQKLREKYCPRTGGRVTYEYPSRKRALLPGSHLPPSPQPLSEGDLKSLHSELYPFAAKCFFLGIHLQVPTETLECIKHDFFSVTECLLEMLIAWLGHTYPTPTWSIIIDALESLAESDWERDLAQQLKAKYYPRSRREVTYEYPTRESTSPPGALSTQQAQLHRFSVVEHHQPHIFGEFYCEDCEHKWYSRHSRQEKAQRCKQCKKMIFPSRLPLQSQYNVEQGQSHESSSSEIHQMLEYGVASTHLTQKEIESELSEVTTADWFPLGLQLGMELPTLKQLEQDHPHDDQQCMTKVVKWWCQNAPAEATSWERLAQALEVIGGYTNVVQNLRMKMASMPKAASTCLTLKEIENELCEVKDWQCLGVELGLKPSKLKEVHPTSIKYCRIMVIAWWLRNAPEVSWEKLAQAVEAMGGHTTIATKLRRKGYADKQMQTEIVETLDQQVQAGSVAQKGYLRGVEVIDQTTFTCTRKAQSYEWSKFGFKIHIPENALPLDEDKCHIHVKASLSGQFQFPEDTELISGIYWIACRHKFIKPVTVEIQHCAAKLEYSSSLTYIVAKCNQEDLPYQFKTLEGGVFSSSSQYGSINLTHFSGLGVAYHWSSFMHMFGLTTRQPEPNTRSYCARLYYRSSGINCWEVCFAIVCNLELHIAAADTEFSGAVARVGPHQLVEFAEDKISLKITESGTNDNANGEIELENGWSITPLTGLEIAKHQVDQFTTGSKVPSCQLYMEWTGQQEQPVKMKHRVILRGAKMPNNFFVIILPQPPQGSMPLPFPLPGMLQSTSEFHNPAMNPQYSQPQQLHRGHLQTSSQSQCQGDLTEEDLHVITEILRPAAPQWESIGSSLGIPKFELNIILHNHILALDGPPGYFKEMLSKWLKWAPPNHPWPTINALLFALRSNGHDDLAANFLPYFIRRLRLNTYSFDV